MPAPTLGDFQQSNFLDAAGSETTPTVTWSSGDFLVVVGVTEDSGITLGVPTGGPTLTQWVASSAASNCKVYVWSGTAGSGGSGALSSTITGGTSEAGIAAFVFSGSGGRGNTGSIISSAATVVSLIRGTANSAVICVMGDWAAIQDTSVTSEPSAGATQRVNASDGWVSGQYAAWVFDWTDQGAPATTSYGMTAHAGGVTMAGFAVEILGTVGGSATLTPAQGAEVLTGRGTSLGFAINMPAEP